jgi:hydroxymethylglutaryl-CoA reductase
MTPRSFSAFLNKVKSDETLARVLRSVFISANVNNLSAVVAEFALRKGMALDAEALLESLQASMNIASYPEFSDSEIEYMYANKWTAFICSLLSNCNCTRDTDCQEYCG